MDGIGTLFGGEPLLSIDRIRRDPRTQPRNHINHEVVERYRDAMEAGDAFPPVTVFFDGTDYWLADGWHRVCAALCLGWQGIAAEVREGTLRDAEWHSFSANATHGYPRGKDDVSHILSRIFRDPGYLAKGFLEISRHTQIPESTVRWRYRKMVASPQVAEIAEKPVEREVTRGGVTYTMNTSDIGRRAPEFIDNEATWHEGDAYRPPGEEFAHPDYQGPKPRIAGVHYPSPDPKFWNISFPLEHREPAGMIRQMTRMLYEQLNLTPGQTVAALPWLVLPEFRMEALIVADWMTQLLEALPYDDSLERKLKK